MHSKINNLPGLNEEKIKLLKRWKISSIYDLLHYFPRRHLDRSILNSVNFKAGELHTIIATVIKSDVIYNRKKRLEVIIDVQGRRVQLTFFQGIYHFAKILVPGIEAVFSAKVDKFRGTWQMVHPDFEILKSEKEELTHVGRIIPLYKTTEKSRQIGLDSKGIRSLIKKAVDRTLDIPEIFNSDIRKKYNLINRKDALIEIHFPESDDSLTQAKRRLAFEEFFFFHLLMLEKKRKSHLKERVTNVNLTENLTNTNTLKLNFPFKFTNDQDKAIKHILALSQNNYQYTVLLQGDVGSGKTAVVVEIAKYYINSGYQVAFLAPTEILVKQHFNKISSFIKDILFPIEIFVGAEKTKIRLEKQTRLQNGDIRFAIGTHALLQKDIHFNNLGLVIIDEQHRFGVEQRNALLEKGKEPDMIAMTATPIPRTLALSLYGNIETVLIKEKPAGRKTVETKWFTEKILDGIYKGIIKYISKGQQAFIVYPLIEDSEKSDLNACVKDYEELKTTVFANFKVALLHGKMKADEKEKVMHNFSKGKTQILFTTTVIEVGIDIPNATVIVIRNAERFGLSALHQLRGRIGRGSEQGYCILVSTEKITDEGKLRLQALVDSNDGFYLAETDLKIRGPGEFLGNRQSGLPDFKIADLNKDMELCNQSYEEALKINEDEFKIYLQEIKKRFSKFQSIYV